MQYVRNCDDFFKKKLVREEYLWILTNVWKDISTFQICKKTVENLWM